MNSMYEAMAKAAKKDPEFAKQLEEATQSHKARIQEEAAAQRLRAAAAYREKIEREQREAQEKEAKRRQEEMNIVGNPRMYPFGYAYQDLGPYSVTYGIVFALTMSDAEDAVRKRIKKIYEEDASGIKTSYDEEYHERALKTVRVWQLDLSEGISGIGGYAE